MLTRNSRLTTNTADESLDKQLVPSANRLVVAYGLSLLVLVTVIATSYLIVKERLSTQRTLIQANSYVNGIKLGIIESVGVLHDLKIENKKTYSNARLKDLITKRAKTTLGEISSRQAELLGTREKLEKNKIWADISWIIEDKEDSLNNKLNDYRGHIEILTSDSPVNGTGSPLPQIPLEAAGARYGSLFQGYRQASDQLEKLVEQSTSSIQLAHKVVTALGILVLILVSILFVAPLWLKLLSEHKRLKKAHSKLAEIAYTDRETGLPNFAGLERNRNNSNIDNNTSYVFVVRITNLDEISNLIGSYRVSELLIQFSDRLRNLETNSLPWSRSGESEFCCLLPKESFISSASWAQNLHSSLTDTLAVDGIVVRPQVTMAVAGLSPTDEQDTLSLWEHQSNARLALGTFAPPNCWLPEFEQGMKNALEEQNDLINQISDGLKNKQFLPYYQIKVDANTGNPCSVEVLARWVLPDNSVVSPGLFIPAAENSGQIIELTYSLFDQVLADVKQWCGQGLSIGRVAINVAADVLYHKELISRLSHMNEELPDLCEGIEVEITENIALGENMENIESILNQIRSLGIEIAIDDFGTGYASLQTLVDLPFDVLKVDRSFLVPMQQSGSGQEVISAMIRLCTELHKRCVVEGVETDWQWKILAEMGADELQGFYFHKPAPAMEIQQLMQSNQGWRMAG